MKVRQSITIFLACSTDFGCSLSHLLEVATWEVASVQTLSGSVGSRRSQAKAFHGTPSGSFDGKVAIS